MQSVQLRIRCGSNDDCCVLIFFFCGVFLFS